MSDADRARVVDEQYWLGRAAAILTDSAERLDEGARGIAAAMAWFWTVYSAAATAALAIAAQEVTWPRALLVTFPALSIFVAYTLATWASLPIPVRFNVIAPYDIKAAHDAVIQAKRGRLKWSFGFAALSAILVSGVVLGFALTGRPRPEDVVFAVAPGDGGNELIVEGRFSRESRMLVQVTPAGHAAVSRVVAVPKDRSFTLAVPVPRAARYEVETSWAVGGRTTRLKEVVPAP